MVLSVVSKNANYRVNFDNFQDADQPWAVGTIKDFPQVTQTPALGVSMEVASIVTLTVGGSDYPNIPLFYCPKKQYWDTPAHGAQDVDQVGKKYYNAYLSFRVGDQVKVLMQTDSNGKQTPVAAFGFADGVPRLGENVFKSALAPYWIQCDPYTLYAAKDTGPDGLNLKLVTACQKFTVQGKPISVPIPLDWVGLSNAIFTDCQLVQPGDYYTANNGVQVQNTTGEPVIICSSCVTTYPYSLFSVTYVTIYLIQVGPFLYIFLVITPTAKVVFGTPNVEPGGPSLMSAVPVGTYCNPCVEMFPFFITLSGVTELPDEYTYPWAEYGGVTPATDPTYPPTWPPPFSNPPIAVGLAVGLNNAANMAAAQALQSGDCPFTFNCTGNLFNPWPPAGFTVIDEVFTDSNGDISAISILAPLAAIIQAIGNAAGVNSNPLTMDLQMKVRPHLKADLQTAGMWPPGMP